MPKVNKGGVFSEKLGFSKEVPACLKATCHNCFAELETEETGEGEYRKVNEPKAKVARRRDRRSGCMLAGWKIPCPECGAKVFFSMEQIPANLFARLNPKIRRR